MLEEFLKECCTIEGLVFAIGNRSAISELEIKEPLEPLFEGGAMHLAGPFWAAHLNMKDVASVQFTKAKERTGLIPFILMAMLMDSAGTALCTIFFPNPWLGTNHMPAEYQENRYAIYEMFKYKYTSIGPGFFKVVEDAAEAN